mmetsp:Transcript_61591/g.188160  ORF Transcript_61591/g.188160 Transcript_61591/m.188160 type:complete len:453 (-) Transcript_61591:235-1593(-)
MVEEEERRAVTHLRGLRDEAGPHTVRALLDSAQRSLILQASAAMRVHQNQVLVLRERVAQPLGHGPIIVRNRPAAALLEQYCGHALLEHPIRTPSAEYSFQFALRVDILKGPVAGQVERLHQVHEIDIHLTTGGLPRDPIGPVAGRRVEIPMKDPIGLVDRVQHHAFDAAEGDAEAHIGLGSHIQKHVGHCERAQHTHGSGPCVLGRRAHDEATVERGPSQGHELELLLLHCVHVAVIHTAERDVAHADAAGEVEEQRLDLGGVPKRGVRRRLPHAVVLHPRLDGTEAPGHELGVLGVQIKPLILELLPLRSDHAQDFAGVRHELLVQPVRRRCEPRELTKLARTEQLEDALFEGAARPLGQIAVHRLGRVVLVGKPIPHPSRLDQHFEAREPIFDYRVQERLPLFRRPRGRGMGDPLLVKSESMLHEFWAKLQRLLKALLGREKSTSRNLP